MASSDQPWRATQHGAAARPPPPSSSSSRWATPGPSGAPTRNTPNTGSGQSRWQHSPQEQLRGAGGYAGISKSGLRMARRELGRKPDDLDLLLSPSRGVQDDEASLRNPEIQERLRNHIQEKLRKWAAAPRERASRQEELGTILLDFRKLREGVTSSRRTDAFACEVYEASVLLALANSNEPQLASSLPHLVSILHPATLAHNRHPSHEGSVNERPTKEVSDELARLSLGRGSDTATSRKPSAAAEPAVRAFYLVLHLLHAYLLPSESAPPPSTSGGETNANIPTASSFLPTLSALLSSSGLPQRSHGASERRHHPDVHIDYLLALRRALEQNAYAHIASHLLPLSHLPPVPPAVRTHLETLHLSSPAVIADHKGAIAFNPIAHLLQKHAARLRTNRIWPAVRRAYRFPPDPTDWLGKVLLFEFEVECERAAAGTEGAGRGAVERERSRRGGEEGVREDWEAEEEDEVGSQTLRQEEIRREAARRAAEFVAKQSRK